MRFYSICWGPSCSHTATKQLDHFFYSPSQTMAGKNFMALPQAAVPINYLIQLALKYIEPPVGKYLPPTANIHVLLTS